MYLGPWRAGDFSLVMVILLVCEWFQIFVVVNCIILYAKRFIKTLLFIMVGKYIWKVFFKIFHKSDRFGIRNSNKVV